MLQTLWAQWSAPLAPRSHFGVEMAVRSLLQDPLFFQVGTQPFNRAMLFNVGFQEAMKDLDWDCLIFHDVDHIPESDRNYYGCGQMPRHFATKLDKYMYL